MDEQHSPKDLPRSPTLIYATDAGGAMRTAPAPFSEIHPELPPTQNDLRSRVIANSPAMHAVLEEIRRFASHDLPVLITGEPGTGKKLVARTIHENSRRCAAPFLAVRCSPLCAWGTDLELFGGERDAAPGTKLRRGPLERAAGGMVFLDEIGSLPESSQATLLWLLDDSEVIRLGGPEPIRPDVRLITAATVADPGVVAAPALRPDLYYRLSVLRLHLPPLRHRAADIEPLAVHLLQRISGCLDRDVWGFSPEALAVLCRHSWPGNVRELIGVIQRAVVLSRGAQVERHDLHFEASPAVCIFTPPLVHPPAGSAAERNLLLDTLGRVRFSITRAARELNVSRVTLYRMLRRNGLELQKDAVMGEGTAAATTNANLGAPQPHPGGATASRACVVATDVKRQDSAVPFYPEKDT